MLSFKDKEGNKVLALAKNGKEKKVIYVNSDENGEFNNIRLKKGCIKPLPDIDERQVIYVAGPSGSGKTTYALDYVRSFLTLFPDKEFFLFSRTHYKDDPAYKDLEPTQIMADQTIIEDPIDITQELSEGAIILFDDCNTIPDDKIRKAVEKLMCDILEVGRKLGIYIVITNHLVVPNERKMARTILNEMQMLTVFPKSGSVHQITHVLKNYFGFTNKQINKILDTKSRWITFKRSYPQLVLNNTEVYTP